MATQIFDIQMRSLHDVLEKQNIILKITEPAKKYLALTGFTPKYGARQIGGIIRQQIRRPVSKMIVSGQIEKGSEVILSLHEEKLDWKINKV